MNLTKDDYLNYGTALVEQEDFDKAIFVFGKAIEAYPGYAPLYATLGLVYREKKRLEEAEVCLQKAVEISPDDVIAYNNLGLVLLDLHELQKAEQCFLKAIELDTEYAELHNNLGLVYEERLDLKKAEACYRHAIDLRPNYVDAYYNLGTFFKASAQMPEAEEFLVKAVKLCPTYYTALYVLGIVYLLKARYEDGWKLYEAFRVSEPRIKPGSLPLWQGEDLADSSILLFYEYGFGDTIQFVRYAKMVEKSAAKMTVWVQPPLKKLLEDSYPSIEFYSGEQLPDKKYDYACSIMSLPIVYDTRSETIPADIPYLHASALKVAAWQEKIQVNAQAKKLKVGVVWAGNPRHPGDDKRSIDFSVFKDIFKVKDVSWFSLQVGNRCADLENLEQGIVADYSVDLTDYAESAAFIANLDLVITVDSSVVHLAGGLGKPTWVLLAFVPDWRWELDREDSLWYPNVKPFRQKRIGDWENTIVRVSEELKAYCKNR